MALYCYNFLIGGEYQAPDGVLEGEMVEELQTSFEISGIEPDWNRIGVAVPPFSIEADPRFMYLSTETRRALSKVSYMVEAAQGASVVVGEVGTGKTTLSTDPSRKLIGDDEHGWSDKGVFNFEGGCYAKAINLSRESEPEIYECTRKFGTILENVAFNIDTRRIDLNDDSLTENTRAAYPITHIPTAERRKAGGHPENIIMLTADAFGVMPPISRLTPEQTLYHFVSGYTSKIGGTEVGLGKEPQATFSACFGAPFMALHPYAYAQLLREKILKHNVKCWLVNTGWVGGPYGVGNRIKLEYTRQLIKAALSGMLAKSSFVEENVFGLKIPKECQDVPKELLNPIQTWKKKNAYMEKAKDLAGKFRENFRHFANNCESDILEAGPKI